MSEMPGDQGPPVLYQVGDRVRILLESDTWGNMGWLEGRVVGMEPYSQHRCFYWVQLDVPPPGAPRLISVLNPKKIQRVDEPWNGVNHASPPR